MPIPINQYGAGRPTFTPADVTMMDKPYGVVPVQYANSIVDQITYNSAFMRLAEEVPIEKPIEYFESMGGVEAYMVDEASPIPTSSPSFSPKQLVARKFGVIIPVSKETLRWAMPDFFPRVQKRVAYALYRKFDEMAFTGGKAAFGYSLLDSATTAGNVITETANKYDDISKAMALLEDNDFNATGIASLNSQKVKYRNTKDNNGMPIFNEATAGLPATIIGLPIGFLENNAFQKNTIAEVVGDWRYAQYGLLGGIEYEISTQASITTLDVSDNEVPISAFQRDLAYMKATMWAGFMIDEDGAFAVINKAVTP